MPKTTTANSATNAVLDLLRATYKTLFIPVVEAGREIGMAEGTTRNLLTEEKFPLPTTTRGTRRYVTIFDLADYVSRKSPALSSLPSAAASASKPSKRGPRFKKDRMEEQGRA